MNDLESAGSRPFALLEQVLPLPCDPVRHAWLQWQRGFWHATGKRHRRTCEVVVRPVVLRRLNKAAPVSELKTEQPRSRIDQRHMRSIRNSQHGRCCASCTTTHHGETALITHPACLDETLHYTNGS